MSWEPDVAQITNEFIPWSPWNAGVAESRVALISTGGVYLKKGLHEPFRPGDPSFREFPSVVANDDLELPPADHLDLRYAAQDLNVLFPLERLHELAASGYIGSVAPFAYSLAGRTGELLPLLANFGPSLAYRMRRMGPDLALVVATGAVEHQTAALVARAVELAGVPTLVLGNNRAVLEAVKAPRAVLVRHPDGAPLGNPGNAGKHQQVLLQALQEGWRHESPGLISELSFSWKGD